MSSDNRMDRGLDRSIVAPTDPDAAFMVEGWFAGYARSGLPDSPYGPDHARQHRHWVAGYRAGLRQRARIAEPRLRGTRGSRAGREAR